MEKNNNKIEKIAVAAILVILFSFFVQLFAGEIIYKVWHIDLGKARPSVKTKVMNWAEQYPFSEQDSIHDTETAGIKLENVQSASSVKLNKITRIYNSVAGKLATIGGIGDSCLFHIIRYEDVAKWGFVCSAALTDPGVGGKYTRLQNGQWTTVKETEENLYYLNDQVKAIESLDYFLKDKGIPFLYVQSAMKACKYDPELPPSVVDYTNQNIDSLLENLAEKGIPFLDLREKLHEDFEDHYSLFYKTDHHWNVEAGIWACNILEDYLQENYHIAFDKATCDPSHFYTVTYDNAMFGSMGQGVTHFVADADDVDILYPDFDTELHVRIPDRQIDEVGNFESLMVNSAKLKELSDRNGGYAYDTILMGNRPLIQITNLKNTTGPRVLLIRDSFSIVATPYLALGCSELDLIDSRKTNGNFNGSIRSYIREMNPDMVIVFVSSPDVAYK